MPKYVVVETPTTEEFDSYKSALAEATSYYREGEEITIYEVTKKFAPTKVVFEEEEF
jgi:hypothetical protein